VPFASEGVSIEQTWDTMGLRATGSHTIVFDDVFVPDAAVSLVRPADVWHPVWNIVINAAMPLISSAYVGIADAAVDEAMRLIGGRADQHIVQLVGEMTNAHLTAQDVVAAMFVDSDNLQYPNTDDSISSRTLARKSVAADAVIDTVRLAIEATGGAATRAAPTSSACIAMSRRPVPPLPRAKQTTLSGRVALGLSPTG
jgi:acyl-CoA dehydrogenase